MSDIKVVRDENGQIVMRGNLTAEDKENLYVLFHSAGWKLYRQMLISMKDGHQLALLPEENPNKVLKGLGIVVGLNAAINQLGVSIAQFEKTAARVTEESKNQS